MCLLITETLFLAVHLFAFSVSSFQFFQDLAGKPSSHEFVKGEFNSSFSHQFIIFNLWACVGGSLFITVVVVYMNDICANCDL